MLLRASGVALAFVLGAAAPAAAAPSTLGTGRTPAVAVDAAGTAYIAWTLRPAGAAADELRFCRLPRGASACDVARALPVAGRAELRPYVRVRGNRVDVVQSRYGFPLPGNPDQIVAFRSLDRGATFTGPSTISTFTALFDAVDGPGNTLTMLQSSPSGGHVQNVPDDSSSGTRATLFAAGQGYPGAIGLVDPATPLAIFNDGADDARLRRYSGSGALSSASSWLPAVAIGRAAYPHLASGPRGLFLLSRSAAGPTVRRFDGSTFAPGVALPDSGSAVNAHLAQDAGGRLHAVWERGQGGALHLIHGVSDDGVTFRTGSLLSQDAAVGVPRVAVAPDHVGVAIYESRGEIRAIALGPGAPTTATPPPPPPPPPSGPPPPPGDTVVPAPQAGVRVQTRVLSGSVTVTLPGGRSQPLDATAALPVGTVVDARKGELELVAATGVGARTVSARVKAGIFRVRQQRAKANQRTALAPDLQLVTPAGARRCRAPTKGIVRAVTVVAKGLVRTTAGAAVTTAKGAGASWTTQDRCDGTFVRVTRGRVAVKATKGKRRTTTTLKARQSRLIKAQIFKIRSQRPR